MRVALLALHFAEYSGRLALSLAEDCEVLLILGAANARNELSAALQEELEARMYVRYVELPRFRNPRVLATIAGVRRIIRDYAPDVLHVQEFHQAFITPSIEAMLGRVPVIMTVHDPLPHSGWLSRDGWRWQVVQWVRRRCDRLIVHGSRNRRALEQSNAAVAGRVDVVPHGVLGRQRIDDDIRCSAADSFLFFGRIEPYKGLRYLLDAGDALRRRGHRLRLVIAGRGSDLARHRERIVASPWIELIERYVPAEHLERLFRRALAVVLPYTDATQSGVSAMAFAHARPVIATDVGDVPEIVVDGEAGLIVPPCDSLALADGMRAMLTDRRLRDRLALGAARLARERLCWDAIARQTLEVYGRAMQAERVVA